MTAQEFLQNYSQKIVPLLEDSFQRKKIQAQKISSTSVEQIEIFHHLLQGGKKIRGALMLLGYLCAGQKENLEILKTSLAIEIQHAALLIEDDIMDKSDWRRGQPSIHRLYQSLHHGQKLQGDAEHFGLSMAIDEGLLGIFLALEILNQANFPLPLRERVLTIWAKFLLETAYGQGLDVKLSYLPRISQKDLFKIHTLKTARYTLVGPLIMGATFGGAQERILKALANYGEKVGLAFQLHDDELGLFADSQKLGKAVGDDIRENKNTLLKMKAMELSTKKDRLFLQKAYGNRNLSKLEIEKVKTITQDCEALRFSQKMCEKLVKEGKRHIEAITTDDSLGSLLSSLADFLVKRDY